MAEKPKNRSLTPEEIATNRQLMDWRRGVFDNPKSDESTAVTPAASIEQSDDQELTPPVEAAGDLGGIALSGIDSQPVNPPTLTVIEGGKQTPRYISEREWRVVSAAGIEGQVPLHDAAKKAEIAHLIGGPNEWRPPEGDVISRTESQNRA